ncbi:chromosome segregation protein SMC, partial [Candidatus Parcubacteria bacterium]
MAEVSITFADCEQSLGIEYHEVTLTRRVFRSGEGQYFFNKTPCRLKDIQRMFLGTGIGTTSYSLMEQGQIDKVLSSHPEDRRTIFEEASGITKFKADKKEAIRKLEYTEANLLRLADVIREVKRQIISLQRQAGKARRYKELTSELRKYDVDVSKHKLGIMDSDISRLHSDISSHTEKIRLGRAEIAEIEQGNDILRKSILQSEREVGSIMEKGMEARSRLEHTQEMIQVNRRQIEEYDALSKRDANEIDKTSIQIDAQRQGLSELSSQIEKTRTELTCAESELKEANNALSLHQQQVETMRRAIQELRSESVEIESQVSKLRNHLAQMETQEHSDAIRRERLYSEQIQLDNIVKRYDKRQSEMQIDLESCRTLSTSESQKLDTLIDQEKNLNLEISRARQLLGDARARASVIEAKMQILTIGENENRNISSGTHLLMDKSNPLNLDTDSIFGLFASHLTVEDGYSIALESVLKSLIDAVLVRNRSVAVSVINNLREKQAGPARMLILEETNENNTSLVDAPPGARLSDHVKAPENIMPLVVRLLGNVILIDNIESLPQSIPFHAMYVTRSGTMLRGDGYAEYWMPGNKDGIRPSRFDELTALNRELEETLPNINNGKITLEKLSGDFAELASSIAEARTILEEKKHALAIKEGEYSVVSSEAAQAKDRLNTVTWELNNLSTSETNGPTQRAATADQIISLQAKRDGVLKEIEANTMNLQELENKQSELQSIATEKNIKYAQICQNQEHLGMRHSSIEKHMHELELLLKDRTEGLTSHQNHIEQLNISIVNGENQMGSLREAVESNTIKVENLRRNMEKQVVELDKLETMLSQRKAVLESIQTTASSLNIKLTETTMRRQNQLDRITSEYGITESQLFEQTEHEWEGEKPSIESMETMIAEIRTKIEAMGPVNLVAIEEYQEHEERHNFLTKQEQDLVTSKQQLMEMIKKINITTSEMFSQTFNAVNENFQNMFKRLFNGGSAKLVLVNEEDVLECGIEIIARPPGKRLQNISLLSGGERTLTAVAL